MRTLSIADNLMDCAEGAQAVVLMTEWDDIVMADWRQVAQVVRQPKFLFDGRNALNPHELQEYGFRYKGIGRGASVRSALSAAGV